MKSSKEEIRTGSLGFQYSAETVLIVKITFYRAPTFKTGEFQLLSIQEMIVSTQIASAPLKAPGACHDLILREFFVQWIAVHLLATDCIVTTKVIIFHIK